MATWIDQLTVLVSGKIKRIAAGDTIQLKNAADTKSISFNADTGVVAVSGTGSQFTGSGAGLTSVPVTALVLGGTELSPIYLSDALLSSNVPLLDGGQAFVPPRALPQTWTSTNTFTQNVSFSKSVFIGENLVVTGEIISAGAASLIIGDNFIDLNAGNILDTPFAGGASVNISAFSGATVFDATDFTAGVDAGVNPTITVTASAGSLALGDLIQVSGTIDSKNDGQYVVLSAVGTTITVKGVGSTGINLAKTPFAHTQFSASTGETTAKVVKANFSVIAASNGLFNSSAIPAGTWSWCYGATETAFSTWTSLASVSTPDLQAVYAASASPATIELANAKSLNVYPAALATAGFNFSGNNSSSVKTTDGAELGIGDATGASPTSLVGVTNLPGASRLRTSVPTATGVAVNDLCYIDGSGEAQKMSNLSEKFVAGVKAANGSLASIRGSIVAVASTDALVGSDMYVSTVAGRVSTAIPTAGRITFVGTCVNVIDGSTCEVLFAPQYIADL